jgi:hypothetical protein
MGAMGGSFFHFIKGTYNSCNVMRLAGGTQTSTALDQRSQHGRRDG